MIGAFMSKTEKYVENEAKTKLVLVPILVGGVYAALTKYWDKD